MLARQACLEALARAGGVGTGRTEQSPVVKRGDRIIGARRKMRRLRYDRGKPVQVGGQYGRAG
jgi:hypothetical protein